MSLQTLGQFRLFRIASVSARGALGLEGTNAKLILTGTPTPADVGRQAVCHEVIDGEGETLVVIGVVRDSEAVEEDGPIVLRNGAATLSLHKDGRIKLRGSDIGLDADAGLRMKAARIELN